MSKLDIINAEILRRQESTIGLEASDADLLLAIEQFNKLDEFYREQEGSSRTALEGMYLEDRHFTGEWPIVYTFAQVEKRPYFGGQADTDCNPYYPITKVQDSTFDGLSPLASPITKTGAFQRQRTFAATENVTRTPALTQLQNFPDITDEPLPPSWPAAAGTIVGDQCYYGVGGNQTICEADGGIWGLDTDPEPDPIWVGADTAPALLRVSLTAWRADLVIIRDDIYDSASEVSYWQGLIDDIDTVLAAITADAVFIRNTGDADPATWGQTQVLTGADETARANLETAADTGILAHIATRSGTLTTDASVEEQIFFGLIGMRLHQVNGSYSKLSAAKANVNDSIGLVADNVAAIALLNLMKVKES